MLFRQRLLATIAAAGAVPSISAASLFDTAAASPSFSTLAAAVEAADLADALRAAGTFTVFAPDDAAFDALPDATVARLFDRAWRPQLRDLLLYHVLGSEVRSTDLTDGLVIAALNREDLTVRTAPPRVNEDSRLLLAAGAYDIEADNGVIHGVDTVLTPRSVTSTVVERAAEQGLSTLAAAVTAAGLTELLSSEGPFTLFAPTDAAFAALPEGTLDHLLNPDNIAALIDLLTYHVVGTNALAAMLSRGRITTLHGETIVVGRTPSGVLVNDAEVVEADVVARNGVVHVIDKVLLPSTFQPVAQAAPGVDQSIFDIASGSEEFATLASALEAADLTDALSAAGTYTVFAPDDRAFGALPTKTLGKLLDPVWKPQLRDLLLYHVLGSEVRSSDLSDGLTAATLNREDVTLNTAPPRVNEDSFIMIEEGVYDIEASNGVVHGVDAVLSPSSLTANIVDRAAELQLTTLLAAVAAAGLAETLSGAGPFTLFAPTDAAFRALPKGTLDSLLRPENAGKLRDVLKYHVVAANALRSDLSRGRITTLNGDAVTVTMPRSDVRVNGAAVVVADILASNGIVHVVDAVLLPPQSNRDSTSPKSKSHKSSKWDKSSKSSKEGRSYHHSKASKSAKDDKSSKGGRRYGARPRGRVGRGGCGHGCRRRGRRYRRSRRGRTAPETARRGADGTFRW